MGVYVGMDVHRKRSRVAVLDEGGRQLLNHNLPDNPAELTRSSGTWQSVPRARSRPPTAGLAGRPTRGP